MRRQVVHTPKVPPARVPLSQAIRVGENLKSVLEAAESSLDRVVKVTIYMADLSELMAMNNVFSQYFAVDPPARTTFQCAGLVGGARVEIEAIATVESRGTGAD